MRKIASENAKKLLGTYVAFLRSLYLLHQNHHWQTGGSNFYGNHQLFQKIYETAAENADSAAEKAVGLCGHDCVDLPGQSVIIQKLLSKYGTKKHTADDYIEASLKAEKDFLHFSKSLYNSLEQSEDLTLGLDDLIMAVANEREHAVYFLQQALTHKEYQKMI